MVKKALLMGVNTYPPPADSLDAPLREVVKWRDLLIDEYEFDPANITTLTETDATRQAVLDGLRDLLTNASGGDILFAGFACHGAETNGWESDTKPNQRKEHGLIMYAGPDGSRGFQHASITPSDVARILKEFRTPSDALFVLGVDSCFAAAFDIPDGGFEGPPEINPKVLFIPRAVPGLGSEEPITFAQIGALVGDTTIAFPMVVAAAKANQTAVEVGEQWDRRFLFSREAIERLEDAFDDQNPISSRVLVDEINPLRKEQQEATIVGNNDPEDDLFVGGFPVRQPPSPIGASVGEPATIAAQWWLRIRIIGLATFITLRDDEKYFRTRIVLPFDTYKPSGPMHHFGFVEVADRDFRRVPSGAKPYTYLRSGEVYSRWTLHGDRVRIANVAGGGQPLDPSLLFRRHVPRLTVVTPELENYPEPRHECFRPFPKLGLFNGFLDFQAGDVTIGELEPVTTTFKGQYTGDETWGPEKTPFCAIVTVPLERDHAVITIEDSGNRKSVIWVNSGATIAAGNAREADITGPGSGEGPREHFLVYYNVAPIDVTDAGLPEKNAIPINACTVTGYP
jgi:hypothetical protein